MKTVIIDFDIRVQEVNAYFIFLEKLMNKTIKLTETDNDGKNKVQHIDTELAKTLKANSFLLLYNLVESTMRNAIQAIFDEFRDQEVSFDNIKPHIKVVILQNFRTYFNNDFAQNMHSKFSQISMDIINVTFEREKIFSGNVDARVIQKTANKYGFSTQTDCSVTNNGKNLVVVKNSRNDLAHGTKSFEEVGRDKTIEEILKIKQEVVEYLRQILKNIQSYLDNKDYLDSVK